VIYSDVNGNTYNRDVDAFFEIYSFHSVDGALEKRLESLIQFNEDDYSTVNDPEDQPGESLAQSLLREVSNNVVAAALESEPEVDSTLTVRFGLVQNEGQTLPTLTEEDLSSALALYSEEPNFEFNLTHHRLLFQLGGNVTMETLRQAFHPSQSISTFDWFQVQAAGEVKQVVWESWIGVYPEYSKHGLYASVIVGTPDSPVDTEETPGTEAVVVPAHVEQQPLPIPVEEPVPLATSGYSQVIPGSFVQNDIMHAGEAASVAPGAVSQAVAEAVAQDMIVPTTLTVSTNTISTQTTAVAPVVNTELAPVIQNSQLTTATQPQASVAPATVTAAPAPVVHHHPHVHNQ
jgi:hypothetical protein